MIKKIILLLLIVLGYEGNAQVGINTTTPKAQLEIKSTNEATPANTDGLIIPKINAFPAINPTADQQGMLVYLTTTVGANTPGFYYWNNPTVAWLPIGNNNNSDWKLAGNSGTNSATHFIGTTDNQDVIFKRFNFRSGLLGITSTSFGFNALNPLVSGGFNTAFGVGALDVCSTGYENTAVGYDALGANTTGFYNTAFGRASLLVNTDGFDNSAYGYQSLRNNLTGNYNAAFGRQALLNNSTGESNVAVGKESLKANTTGSFNTAIGYQAFLTGTILENATAIGSRSQVASSNSLVLGSIAGVNGATSSVNVGIGTTSPLDRLHVVGNLRMVDGNQGAGKVLTSDANGTATWTTPAAGTGGTLDQAYDFGGAGGGRTITADTGAVTIAGTDGLVSTGTLNSGALAPSGAGTRMVWNPRKSAFRAGNVGGTSWDDANIGTFSTAFGLNASASGIGSFAIGAGSTASGLNSLAAGFETIASGNQSIAFGASTTSSGQYSTAFGLLNTASGDYSSVFGLRNTSASFAETVIGIGATTYTPSTNGAIQFNSTNVTDRLFVIGNAIDSNNNFVVDLAERRDAMVVLKNGNTGIGSSTPQDKLHIVGNLRMVDGNQAAGKVLTSDANGTATWTTPAAGTGGTLDQAYDFGGAGAGRTITADTGAVTIAGTDGLVSTGTSGSGALAPSGEGTRMVWNPRKRAFRAGRVLGTEWDDSNIGLSSVAFGFLTIASGTYSSAFGGESTASGIYSAAFGRATTASSFASTAFGHVTLASGDYTTAFGSSTVASGDYSTVFGYDNTASSYGETVLGIGATTYTPSPNGETQFRSGNGTDRLFVVGNAIDVDNDNGIDPAERSNALVILKNGNTGIGSSTPARKFHVSNGVSGGTSNVNTGILLESSGNVYQHYLAPSTNESGMLFGSELASINGGIIFNNSIATNGIQFRAGGNVNRMTITSAGDVGIGTTAPGGQFELSLNEGRKPTSNTWTIPSDARLKNVEGVYQKGLTEILQLKPIRYHYKNTDKKIFEAEVLEKEAYGFLAQEVQQIFPEAVGTDADGYLNFDLHPILVAYTNAFKELHLKNQAVENKNRELELKLQSQEQIINSLIKRLEKLEAKN